MIFDYNWIVQRLLIFVMNVHGYLMYWCSAWWPESINYTYNINNIILIYKLSLCVNTIKCEVNHRSKESVFYISICKYISFKNYINENASHTVSWKYHICFKYFIFMVLIMHSVKQCIFFPKNLRVLREVLLHLFMICTWEQMKRCANS